ncbi:MAG: hypothetical protein JXQ83_08305, partial [Candidatus Glassbacteria bacterium]|nr:hypothetical protein [Candidatus Glassbacteria bacterium]
YRELDFLSPYADPASSTAGRFCVIEPAGAATEEKTSLGHPLCACTDHTLYLPAFFGHDTANPRLAKLVDSFLGPAVDKNCELLEVPPGVDLTVSRGTTVLVAACNYAHADRRVRVRLDTAAPCRALWQGVEFKLAGESGGCVLEAVIPARNVAGFVFG